MNNFIVIICINEWWINTFIWWWPWSINSKDSNQFISKICMCFHNSSEPAYKTPLLQMLFPYQQAKCKFTQILKSTYPVFSHDRVSMTILIGPYSLLTPLGPALSHLGQVLRNAFSAGSSGCKLQIETLPTSSGSPGSFHYLLNGHDDLIFWSSG